MALTPLLDHSTSLEALKSLLSTTGHWHDFAHLELQGAWEHFTSIHTYAQGVGLLARYQGAGTQTMGTGPVPSEPPAAQGCLGAGPSHSHTTVPQSLEPVVQASWPCPGLRPRVRAVSASFPQGLAQSGQWRFKGRGTLRCTHTRVRRLLAPAGLGGGWWASGSDHSPGLSPGPWCRTAAGRSRQC